MRSSILVICYCPEAVTRRYSGKKKKKKKVLNNFAEFTGKRLCQSLFNNKAGGLRSAILLKKRLWHRFSSVNFAKILRTSFL